MPTITSVNWFRKTLLGSLNRAKETIERVETAGVVRWRLIQAARARCQ